MDNRPALRLASDRTGTVVTPASIDARPGPNGTVDVTFEWVRGAPTTLRLPGPTAAAIGGDISGLATGSHRRPAFPNPPAGRASSPRPAGVGPGPAHPLPLPGRARRAGFRGLLFWLILSAVLAGAALAALVLTFGRQT